MSFKPLKNKFVQATIRHALSIAGVYIAVTFPGNEAVLGAVGSAVAYLLSILDKAQNQ